MGSSDLSKQLDDRKSSNKEQPYSMGRQTVRKARPDLTDKDFQASIKLKTMPAVKWLEVEFPISERPGWDYSFRNFNRWNHRVGRYTV